MRAVANASSLIHPAKVPEFWNLMKQTFETIYIPKAVYKEILKGREIQSPDIPIIERAVSEGWIKVLEVEIQPPLPENLGKGEKEAIALTEQIKLNWLLLDDRVASIAAKLRGIRVRSITYLILYWKQKGVINQSQAIQLLDDLVKSGYYLSLRDYITVKELIVST